MNNYTIDKIENKASEFNNYFFNNVLKSKEERKFIIKLIKLTNAFLFGGVIRDYFIDESKTPRDIDIVFTEKSTELDKLLNKYLIKKNRFGGYKLLIGNVNYDLWMLKDTWTYKEFNQFDFEIDNYLPATSFFNLTAITYSLNKKNFKLKKSFVDALNKRSLDIVNYDNPYPELCIVKAYEYQKNFKMKLAPALRKYVIKNFNASKEKIESVQLKHYNKVLYSNSELNNFYMELTTSNSKQKSPEPINQLSLFESKKNSS